METEVSNEGVKFSDTFTLSIRYCLVQTSVTTTHAFVTARIQFIKPVHSLFKRNLTFSFLSTTFESEFIVFIFFLFFIEVIERNAFSASEEALKDLSTFNS